MSTLRPRGTTRLLSLAALTVGGVASAAPLADADRVRTASGLAVLEISDGRCAVGWSDPAVAGVVAEYGVHTATAPRTRDVLDTWVGDGPATSTVRIAFRDGVEVERWCGCGDPPAISAWLTELAAGTTHRAQLRAAAESPARDVVPVGTWLELAYAEQCSAKPDDAFGVLRFLWEQIPVRWPDQRALRFSRVALELGKAADRSEIHRVALTAMRDAIESQRERDYAASDDWVALNRVLHDDARTLAWLEEVHGVPSLAPMGEHHAATAWTLLTAQSRWAEAGQWVGADLPAWLDVWVAMGPSWEAVATGYGTLRAAGKLRESATLARAALARDDAPVGFACALLSRSTALSTAGRDEKALSRGCEQPAVLGAWSAAQP